MKNLFRHSQGIALVTVTVMTAVLLTITGAGLLFSGLNLRTASNYKTGSGTLHLAPASNMAWR